MCVIFFNHCRQDHGTCIQSESEDEEIEEEQDHIHEQDDDAYIDRITCETEVNTFLEDRPFISYQSSIYNLAKTHVPPFCTVKGCSMPVAIRTEVIYSALYLKWVR